MLVLGLICAWISVSTIGVMVATDDSFWGEKFVPQG